MNAIDRFPASALGHWSDTTAEADGEPIMSAGCLAAIGEARAAHAALVPQITALIAAFKTVNEVLCTDHGMLPDILRDLAAMARFDPINTEAEAREIWDGVAL